MGIVSLAKVHVEYGHVLWRRVARAQINIIIIRNHICRVICRGGLCVTSSRMD